MIIEKAIAEKRRIQAELNENIRNFNKEFGLTITGIEVLYAPGYLDDQKHQKFLCAILKVEVVG